MRGPVGAVAVVFAAGTAWGQCAPNWVLGPTSAVGARLSHAMVYDAARARVVLFGGTTPPGFLSDVWEWDGSVWTQRPSAGGPPARSGHAMAYDSARGRVVVFGGGNQTSLLSDTWEWDGVTGVWMQSAATGPGARAAGAIAFDAARGRAVLFGGFGPGNAPLGDTWEWDGASWRQIMISGPSARGSHEMAYDSARQRVLLLGGQATLSGGDDRLWEYDGAAWTARALTPGAPALNGHAMAYDAARARLVVVGGWDEGTAENAATWEIDPAAGAWAQVSSTGASARIDSAATYDAARGRTVVFGGRVNFNSSSPLPGTWTWDGSQHEGPVLTARPRPVRVAPGAAVVLHVTATGSGGLSYQWFRFSTALVDGGRISGATTETLTITDAGFADVAPYTVRVTDACGSITTPRAQLMIDCIANCDESTQPPVLNVGDFVCFQSRFAAGDSRANCDGSTIPPVLNVNDFICFSRAFAGECR